MTEHSAMIWSFKEWINIDMKHSMFKGFLFCAHITSIEGEPEVAMKVAAYFWLKDIYQ